jgi:hypothetical protein
VRRKEVAKLVPLLQRIASIRARLPADQSAREQNIQDY